jgi:hypothetical protein
MVASLAYRNSFDRRPLYPLALSKTLLRRSLLARAFVALGIFSIPQARNPHGQAVVSTLFPDLTRHVNPEGLRRDFGELSRVALGVGGKQSISAKRQIFFNSRLVGFVKDRRLREMALALGAFRHQKMSASGLASQNLALGGQLKTFRHRLFRFAPRNRFRHKEPRIYAPGSSSQLETKLTVAVLLSTLAVDFQSKVRTAGQADRNSSRNDEPAFIQARGSLLLPVYRHAKNFFDHLLLQAANQRKSLQ